MTDTDDNLQLAPRTQRLLEQLFSGGRAFTPPAAAVPDAETLTRYLLEALSAEQAGAVERGLVSHAPARNLLREVRACLDELQTKPWSEVATRAARRVLTTARLPGEDLATSVAREQLALMSARVSELPAAREWSWRRSWHELREHAFRGVAPAQAAWASFVAFGQQLTAALALPRLASVRGGDEELPTVVGGLPAGVTVEVIAAEVSAEGALRVEVHLVDAHGRPTRVLNQQPAHLGLTVGGEAWHVISEIVDGHRVRWDVRDLGSALGLTAGSLPRNYLHFTIGEPAPQARVGGLPVLADILDAGGQPRSAPPVIIEFVSDLQWRNGQFRVEVAISGETRSAYRDHLLRLDLVLSPHRWQTLGAWRIADWSDTARTLTAQCPGCPTATVALASVLRPRVQAASS